MSTPVTVCFEEGLCLVEGLGCGCLGLHLRVVRCMRKVGTDEEGGGRRMKQKLPISTRVCCVGKVHQTIEALESSGSSSSSSSSKQQQQKTHKDAVPPTSGGGGGEVEGGVN